MLIIFFLLCAQFFCTPFKSSRVKFVGTRRIIESVKGNNCTNPRKTNYPACDECIHNFDIARNCMFCLEGYESPSTNCLNCKDGFEKDSAGRCLSITSPFLGSMYTTLVVLGVAVPFFVIVVCGCGTFFYIFAVKKGWKLSDVLGLVENADPRAKLYHTKNPPGVGEHFDADKEIAKHEREKKKKKKRKKGKKDRSSRSKSKRKRSKDRDKDRDRDRDRRRRRKKKEKKKRRRREKEKRKRKEEKKRRSSRKRRHSSEEDSEDSPGEEVNSEEDYEEESGESEEEYEEEESGESEGEEEEEGESEEEWDTETIDSD